MAGVSHEHPTRANHLPKEESLAEFSLNFAVQPAVFDEPSRERVRAEVTQICTRQIGPPATGLLDRGVRRYQYLPVIGLENCSKIAAFVPEVVIALVSWIIFPAGGSIPVSPVDRAGRVVGKVFSRADLPSQDGVATISTNHQVSLEPLRSAGCSRFHTAHPVTVPNDPRDTGTVEKLRAGFVRRLLQERVEELAQCERHFSTSSRDPTIPILMGEIIDVC